jgi:hypothetical protein
MKPFNELGALRTILTLCRKVAPGPVKFRLYDGYAWAVEAPTDNGEEIARAARSTDQDTLYVIDVATGATLGQFWLVWGNAEDGEELIADFYVNDFTDAVFERFQALYS